MRGAMTTLDQRIARAKEDNPLPVVAESMGYTLRRSGRNYQLNCPFHPDRNPSLSIYLAADGWRFNCFSAACGQRGDLLDWIGYHRYGQTWTRRGEQFKEVLRELDGKDFRQAVASVRLHYDNLPRELADAPEVTAKVRHVWDMALAIYAGCLFSERGQEARAYLKQRGFADKTLRRFRFGLCPAENSPLIPGARLNGLSEDDLLEARLLRGGDFGRYEFFRGGKGFTGRIVSADVDHTRQIGYIYSRVLPWEAERVEKETGRRVAKYMGLADFAKPVGGLRMLPQKRNPVLLMEGVWNRYTAWQWGYDAVDISGARPSPEQAAVLNRLLVERGLIPVPDNDEGKEGGRPPGELALEGWREALPDLPAPLILPVVDGRRIKDLNELAQLDGGEGIFRNAYDSYRNRRSP